MSPLLTIRRAISVPAVLFLLILSLVFYLSAPLVNCLNLIVISCRFFLPCILHRLQDCSNETSDNFFLPLAFSPSLRNIYTFVACLRVSDSSFFLILQFRRPSVQTRIHLLLSSDNLISKQWVKT